MMHGSARHFLEQVSVDVVGYPSISHFVISGFRQHKQAILGDIEEMFLQSGVREKDQSALRFFYKEAPTLSREVYKTQARNYAGSWLASLGELKNIIQLSCFCGGRSHFKWASSSTHGSLFDAHDLPICANFALRQNASD